MGVVSESVVLLLSRLPADLAGGPEAAAALALAESIDNPDSATSRANCVRELREMLGVLRGLAPVERRGSQLDEIANRRQRRRAGAQG